MYRICSKSLTFLIGRGLTFLLSMASRVLRRLLVLCSGYDIYAEPLPLPRHLQLLSTSIATLCAPQTTHSVVRYGLKRIISIPFLRATFHSPSHLCISTANLGHSLIAKRINGVLFKILHTLAGVVICAQNPCGSHSPFRTLGLQRKYQSSTSYKFNFKTPLQ